MSELRSDEEDAERIVETAIRMAAASRSSVDTVRRELLAVIGTFAELDEARAEVTRLRTEVGEWRALHEAQRGQVAEVSQLRAKIEAVHILHAVSYADVSDEVWKTNTRCAECNTAYPCDTLAALAEPPGTPVSDNEGDA